VSPHQLWSWGTERVQGFCKIGRRRGSEIYKKGTNRSLAGETGGAKWIATGQPTKTGGKPSGLEESRFAFHSAF